MKAPTWKNAIEVRPSPNEPGSGFCVNCKRRTKIKWQDTGIGGYEFWGSRGNDVCWEAVCSACGETLMRLVEEE